MPSVVRGLAGCLLGLAIADCGLAQTYPERPIRIVVAFPPGASTDVIARLVGPKLTEAWGQNVVIENRGGAGGNIGAAYSVRATPDGYTLLATSTAFAVNVSLYDNPGYAATNFVPVIRGPSTPNLLFVHPSVAATNVQELLALARAKPMSYGSSGTGTTPHLDGEWLFRSLNRLDVTHVPIGPAQAVTAVAGAQVPIGFTSMPPAVPLAKAGRIRPLAVTSAKRSSIMPDVPTLAEAGFPAIEDGTWFSFFAPAGTPVAIVDRLNEGIGRALLAPDVKERLAALSFEFTPNKAAEFGAILKAEIAKYAKIVKESGAKAN